MTPPLIARLAWRNVWRNRYRSIITIVAVAVGLGALVFLRAFAEGLHHQMVENYTGLISGRLQVHRRGFHERMGLERSIANPEEVFAALSQEPRVTAWAPRIKEYVLASSSTQSAGVLLMGIDPARESSITRLHRQVRQGTFLSDDHDIVLGEDLAKMLGLRLGEKVVIMAQGVDGSLAGAAYRVRGFIDAGAEEIDKGLALITLQAAQQLLVLGQQISEVAIRTDLPDRLNEVVARLTARLDPATYEILTWQQVGPAIAQWIDYDRGIENLILLIVLLIAATGILNTLLMAVLERSREFGIMLAVGTRRSLVVKMVTLESCILGAIGACLGLAGGAGLAAYYGRYGIDLTGFASALEGDYIGSVIYTRLIPGQVGILTLTLLVVCVVTSLYPSWRAASLKPVEAIRHL